MGIRLMYKLVLSISLCGLFGYPGFTAAHETTSVIAIVVGVGNHSGGATMLGIQLTEVTMIGHPQDIAKALGAKKYFSYASCNCLLIGGPIGDCMVREATKVPVPPYLTETPQGRVVVLASAHEFASVFNAVRSTKVSDGSSPPRQPPIILPPSGEGAPRGGAPKGYGSACEEFLACEPATEVEVSTNGETKFAVGCEEGVQIEISTSGSVDLKLGPGPVRMVVPLQSGK